MSRDFGRLARQAVLLTVALAFASCTEDRNPFTPTQGATQSFVTPTGLVTSNPPEIMLGAGDIASCGNNNDEATAEIIDTIPGTVVVIGDNVYPNGTDSEYANCYDPTWGRFKARTKPSAGNHDYNTSGAAGYYHYFGAAAGDPSKGYYSYELGAWHVVVLNSNISSKSGSAQSDWLQSDLAAHPNLCTLAYFHHPLYSSTGGSGSGGVVYSGVRGMWDDMYPAGVDLVLGGHRHFYERLAPMKPDGSADPQYGIREIIAGTGGIGGGSMTNVFPTSEVREGRTFGVLKLYLYDDSYAWKFIPVAGESFTDSGSTACHGAPGGGGTGGGISSTLSTLSATPTTITAGSATSTVTITVLDANGDPVSGATVSPSATGTGNTFSPSSGSSDANGVFTTDLSSTGAGTKTISATANGVGITQTASVLVTAGPIDADQSTIVASPTSVTEGNASTITVTVQDQYGNPISGANVTLAASGSGNALTQPPGATSATGEATGSLSSSVSETKTVSATINGTLPLTHTATVEVLPPGSATSITQLLLTSGGDGANQHDYTTAPIAPAANALVTVAVLTRRSSGALTPTLSGGGMASWNEVGSVDFDPTSGSRERVTVFRAMSATPGSGPLTISYASSVSNVQWIVSQWTGVETGGTNGSGAIGQSGMTAGDGVGGLSLALGAFGNANNVAYGLVGVQANGPSVTPGAGFTEIAETSSGENTELEAEWATNQPSIQPILNNADNAGLLGLEIVAGLGGGGGGPTVDPDQSTVSAAPTGIAVGGETSTITITARDAGGVPVSGVGVMVTATGAGNTLTGATGTTDGSGQWTATLSSTVAEDKSVSAVIDGVAVTQTATVTVNPPGPTVSPSLSTVGATPTSFTTGGSATIAVTVLDGSGNPMAGVGVSLSAPGATITQPAATDGAGMTSGTVSTTQAGPLTVVATAGGTALDQQPVIQVNAGPADAAHSTVAADPTAITEGTGSSTITVTVRDQYGNPLTGSNVSLMVSGTGNTVTAPSATDAGGVTTATLSSTVSELKTISATADGTPITQTATVTVNPPGTASTITHTLLTTGHDVTNQRVYTTAPISPAPNTLVTVAVTTHRSSAAAPEPTLTGGGMSAWEIVATVTYDPIGAEHKRVTIYRAMSAAPGSGPITITSSATVSNCQWIVSQWDGVDQSGSNGSGAIAQTASGAGDDVGGLTTNLVSFGNANDVAYGVFGIASNVPVSTAGSGFTTIAEEPSGEGTPGDVFAEWATNLNTITATWATNSAGALGVEIKAKTGP
jgi:Invasin, domain 3/Bacterial Ig-like domain (group 1)/Calcineurin-like phosphoesterase